MAYEPALVSFILVGMVGGTALVLNASAGWEVAHELSRATERWTVPVITRRYDNDAKGRERLAREAEVLGRHAYRASTEPDLAAMPQIVVAYQLG